MNARHDFDISEVRREFPILKKQMSGRPLIYFDTAATSHKPTCVIDAMSHFYAEEYATVHRAIYEIAAKATETYSVVRRKVQKLIHAKEEEEIIFTSGTTDSINLVASSFGKKFIREGDEILISEMEHHSNIVPWQLMAKERGATLKWVPMTESGELDWGKFQKLLTPKTKIVSLAHIANTTGTCNPIEEIVRAAHAVGAKVMIDGAQAAGHIPLDMQKINCDFYAFSGHKMYGPTGVGILYGKRELLEELPPYQGGGDMIERVSIEGTTFQGAPLKFEAGTPLIAQVIGLGEAIDFLTRWGLEEIRDWEQRLLLKATKALQAIDEVKIWGAAPEKGGIISFTVEGLHALDIGTLMGLKGVALRTGHLCAQPTLKRFGITSLARISFGIYSTPEEVDTFAEVLKETMLLLQPELSF
ncbi:MAG: cysteine desulfurase [Candidatus Algichlamydia australiensis]|nr:cysteine desulfurase [Chlamydiales bacterium]